MFNYILIEEPEEETTWNPAYVSVDEYQKMYELLNRERARQEYKNTATQKLFRLGGLF